MILVTVGQQLPFDRLVRAVDKLQPGIGVRIIAQVGDSSYSPRNFEARPNFASAEIEELASSAAMIIAHAGIGSLFLAQRHRKPIVIMPRRAALREHRNDHQSVTAQQLSGRRGIFVASDENDLPGAVSRGLACGDVDHGQSATAMQLRNAVARFIAGESLR